MKQLNKTCSLIALLLSITAAMCGGEEAHAQLLLSLGLTTNECGTTVNIYVRNAGTNAVEITSEGIAPPWSPPRLWFELAVDGQRAFCAGKYLETGTRTSRRIDAGETVLWSRVSLDNVQFQFSTETGGGWKAAIDDASPHTVTIIPSARWKPFVVQRGELVIRDQVPNQVPKDAVRKLADPQH